MRDCENILIYYVESTTDVKIINQILLNVKSLNVDGFKIQIAGSLDGIDIARKEWQQIGQMPLHTLIAPIKYSSMYVKTNYGIIGIKTWLYIKK